MFKETQYKSWFKLNRPRERAFKQFKCPRPQCVKYLRNSWEAGSYSSNRNVIWNRVHKCPPFSRMSVQTNPVRAILFSCFLPYTPRCSKWIFAFRHPHRARTCILFPPMCATRPAHPIVLYIITITTFGVILRWIFSKWDVGAWIGSIRLRIGTGGGHLWMRWWSFGFRKMWGISWIAENRLASQEGLCCME